MMLTPEIEQRIEGLLARMTLEQKAGQLSQIAAARENLEEIASLVRAGKVGSLTIASSAFAGGEQQQVAQLEDLDCLQRIAVQQSPAGVALLHGRDIIHGCRTVFPIPLAMAASFDPGMLEAASGVGAREGRAIGAHWTFAPMLDIARDPRWGRIAEGFGEDPYLGSVMARAAVRGFQGPDPSQPDRLLACAKHYIAYGGAEGGRDYNTAECTDNTLLNTYVPPFRAAIEAGVATVMSSFNEIGGEPVTASVRVLRRVLREKLGFQGMVVTDWNAVAQLEAHGVASDRAECARLALVAGNDMDTTSRCYDQELPGLVRAGSIDISLVDDAVRRVLRAKALAGLLDRPSTSRPAPVLTDHDRQLAYRVAAGCTVLLRNSERLLPLDRRAATVALVGPLCEERESHLGTWAMDGVASDVVSIADALRERLGGARLRVAPCQSDAMLRDAGASDVIVLCIGEHPCRSGEDASVSSLRLPPGQAEILDAVRGLGKPVVAVICSGRPLAIPEVLRDADAVLWAWHLGVEAGNVIADTLLGTINPSGKLPVTLPRSLGQVPLVYNHKRTGRPGSRRHSDIRDEPLAPFGFGLSYTTFGLSAMAISNPKVTAGQGVTVSARIANTGERPGDEVLQCYIRDVVAQTTRPARELKGFERVRLEPGEQRSVTFSLTDRELGYYGLDGEWRTDLGRFQVWVGSSSAGGREGSFELE